MTAVLDRPTVETVEIEMARETQAGYDVTVVPEVVESRTIYVARHPALEACMSQGDSPTEALENLREVREAYLASMAAAGIIVPPARLAPRIEVLEMTPEAEESTSQQPQSSSSSWRVTKGDAMIILR